MIILNPFEPWPGSLILPAAAHYDVPIITRVVDFGGIFHDDVKPGHQFGASDHRNFRPPGWIEDGVAKLDRLRSIADQYRLTPLQLACIWNLSQSPVQSVIPTLIQEVGQSGKPIEAKISELATLPDVRLTKDEVEWIRDIGDNTGCMQLKGANRSHVTLPEPDRWGISNDLDMVARKWSINPDKD
jgi:aryl-alcohol dehydrogenase-like predicted oxidoreductase